MTSTPATPDNTATNGTPLGWGYHDCIARAIFQSKDASPRKAADAVLAELAKQGYTIATTTGAVISAGAPVDTSRVSDVDALRIEMGLSPHGPSDPDGGRLDAYLIDRAEHDAHADDAPEPEE
jgi:hypothetical protein